MQKYLIITFLVPFYLASCVNTSEMPANIIPQDKMIPILIDVHLADAVLDSRKLPKDSTIQYARIMHKEIYKSHKVSGAAFSESIEYYKQHPELLESMYDELLQQMSIKEAEINKISTD